MTEKKSIKNYNILCIDDSRLTRAFIRNTLAPLNMEIHEAENGRKGLELLNSMMFDLILLDIVMPVMDGFDFIREFHKRDVKEFIPVILMTGLDDLKSKIKGLNIGADDYLVKPLNEEELIARVFSLLRLKKANSDLYRANQQIKRELEAAKKIQQFIIPEDFSFIDYPEISGLYLPIEDIGGDFFDCYRLDDNRSAFLIADVTGHGIPAALTMTMSKMLFNIYSLKFASTSELMKEVNRQLKGILLDMQYITAFYMIYDNSEKTLAFSNAGHTRTLFYKSSTSQVIALDSFGWFLGISDNTDYEEKKINVNPGDRLILYTDGITEAKNRNGEELGEIGLARFIKNNRNLQGKSFCSSLIDMINKYTEKAEINDDIAFLNIEF
jgi:sigma-B regulation protein RsbU (phosphoserine phosphatase)